MGTDWLNVIRYLHHLYICIISKELLVELHDYAIKIYNYCKGRKSSQYALESKCIEVY